MILYARIQAIWKEWTLCEPERHPLSSLHAFSPATPSLIPQFVPPALPPGTLLPEGRVGQKRNGHGNEVWRSRGASPPPHYPVGLQGAEAEAGG